jgi:2-methylcitrate dehydratase PrpD
MGLTYEMAKFITEKGYDNLSEKDVKVAKHLLLDFLGATVKGARERVSKIAIDFIKDIGGIEECGVIGAGFKTSIVNAVLANGTSAHAQELESEGLLQGCLPMTIIPVALAVAEKFNLSGKTVLEGFAIGLEIEAKLGMCSPGAWDRGFTSIGLHGSLGATATACKMMKLSVDCVQNALGICVSQCSSLQRQLGTMAHLLETGIACRNGVTAALLAKGGMTADPNLIEGERGFLDLFCSGGKGYNIDGVITSLGNPFCLSHPGVIIKKYANCFFGHRGMDALAKLIAENDIDYDKVDNVQVEIPTFIAKML